MALTVSKMTRISQFQGIRFPDPNPTMTVDEVKALYAAQYPELATQSQTARKPSATRCAIPSSRQSAVTGISMESSLSNLEQVLRELEYLAQDQHPDQQTPLMRFTRCADWQRAAEMILGAHTCRSASEEDLVSRRLRPGYHLFDGRWVRLDNSAPCNQRGRSAQRRGSTLCPRFCWRG
jgi:PRTRC genetic system protein C